MVTYTAVGEICFQHVVSCPIVTAVDCDMLWFTLHQCSNHEIYPSASFPTFR